jgi:cytochrome c-type biogenesis protein CcmH
MRVLLALILALGATVAASAVPATETQVDVIARELRCVVCQNQSVADSPSEMARQMRTVISERLAAGESPEQVKAYFVSRYGEWVLLSPPTRGFPILAWAVPFGALAGGLMGALLVLRRWSCRGGTPDEAEVDEEALAAVRRELERRAS